MHERVRFSARKAGLALALTLFPFACSGFDLQREFQPIVRELTLESQDWHVGPEVAIEDTGPGRYVPLLYAAFDRKRALETVRFIDSFYRAPANEGYDAVLDRLADELAEVGFGGEDERLQLEFLESGEVNAWTPRSAELVLLVDGEAERVLHSFNEPDDPDRVMLPVHAPSCSVEGEVALRLGDVKKGMILVSAVSPAQVIQRARGRGAAAIVSASLFSFNEDPSGANRQRDAIQYDVLDNPEEQLPVCHISPRSHQLIEEAVDRAQKRGARVRLRFRAVVDREVRPLRTLVATIQGGRRAEEAVAMVSHVQEPGACDNATGVAGLLECARDLAGLLQEGEIDWPARSLVFIWGDEFRQSEAWLAQTNLKAVAGLSSDMTGQSRETGAIALLERMPDPGALVVLPPDAHTPWGAGHVTADELHPNGLAIVARCAMIDVGRLDGNWTSADHPWEGGSDHDVFIRKGIPAVLFWHFTDFTYHTSLDRMVFVDPDEMRRTQTAILATGLSLADPRAGDLDRYLESLEKERVVRVAAAKSVRNKELAQQWEDWCLGAREWLRNQCLGIDESIPRPGDSHR